MAINFWYDLKEMALEDDIKEGSILLVNNMQWRSFDKNLTIQEAYNADYTHFVTTPERPEVKKFIEALRRMNKETLIGQCKKKIEVSLI